MKKIYRCRNPSVGWLVKGSCWKEVTGIDNISGLIYTVKEFKCIK